MKSIRPVYIVGSARIPFAKSMTAYKNETRKRLIGATLNHLVAQYSLAGKTLGDVAIGCLMNGSADWNLAREAVLDTELNPETPAYNIQRACGSGLEATWHIGMKIACGQMDIGIAAGVDTNSELPIEVSPKLQKALLEMNQARTLQERIKPFLKLRPLDILPRPSSVTEPRTRMSMGEHTELMVKEWKIGREAQDRLALRSHQNGAKAYENGFFNDLVFPYAGLSRDATLRGDTTLEKLAKLKPAFDPADGTLTAGNSSPLTDGAASVLLASEKAIEKNGYKPLASLMDFEVSAVDFVKGAGLLMAPTSAVARLLQRNNLGFEDIRYFEIHEAFAGQVLCTLKAWESEPYCKRVLRLDRPLGSVPVEKMNVVGSSIAMGHPFAATGARIAGTLAKLLSKEKSGSIGLISICTAGGMGVAALLQTP